MNECIDCGKSIKPIEKYCKECLEEKGYKEEEQKACTCWLGVCIVHTKHR